MSGCDFNPQRRRSTGNGPIGRSRLLAKLTEVGPAHVGCLTVDTLALKEGGAIRQNLLSPPHRFMTLPCISGSGLGSCTYRRTFPQPSGAPISVSPGGGIRRESSARWGAADVSWAPTWFAAKDEFLKNSPLSPVARLGVAKYISVRSAGCNSTSYWCMGDTNKHNTRTYRVLMYAAHSESAAAAGGKHPLAARRSATRGMREHHCRYSGNIFSMCKPGGRQENNSRQLIKLRSSQSEVVPSRTDSGAL